MVGHVLSWKCKYKTLYYWRNKSKDLLSLKKYKNRTLYYQGNKRLDIVVLQKWQDCALNYCSVLPKHPSCQLGQVKLCFRLAKLFTIILKLCVLLVQIVHYDDVRMGAIASQITSLAIVYSAFYSGVDQRKHQSSASLAFVWGIHRDRWIPRTKGQLRGKCFHLMTSSCSKLAFERVLWKV